MGYSLGVSGNNKNRVALNPVIVIDYDYYNTVDVGRVFGDSRVGTNNYARNDMLYKSSPTATGSTIFPNHAATVTGIDGADITSSQWNNAGWWQNTAQFPPSSWEFRFGGLPILRDMPGAAQNPVVKNQ